jgi:DNA-binding SARP family transcriptional activator/predicted negative regulator of RcsB-dependent stress response
MNQAGSSQPRSLRVHLLGGFRVERGEEPISASAWLRRGAARSIVKLLACSPDHRLHREQILDILWPDVDLDSALNRFGKALHAARHALEPTLPLRSPSSYLPLADDILSLDMERVWIDANCFEELTTHALSSAAEGRATASAFEVALSAYGGELLPEDRYEDWPMARREALAVLHLRTLQAYARLLEQTGVYDRAAEVLRQVLDLDPLREEAHRGLMRIYALEGNRHHALRQYQTCRQLLHEELGTEPEAETEALHQDIFAGRLSQAARSGKLPTAIAAPLPVAIRRTPSAPTVGRDRVLEILRKDLSQAQAGTGQVTLISGEAGVGKTRVAADLAREASRHGVLVLWGTGYAHEHLVPYGPLIEALENYLVHRSEEREELAAQYPLLTSLIPSLVLSSSGPAPAASAEVAHGRLFAAFAGLLAGFATTQPVLLVLDDLHAADAASLQLFQYLIGAAADHRWLILGTYREEELVSGSGLQRIVTAAARESLIRRVGLRPLSYDDIVPLVEALLPGGTPEPALVHRIYALSLGNPLYVHQMVRAMQEEERLVLADGQWRPLSGDTGAVPRQIHELVAARVNHMGEDVGRVLTLAAVVGMEWSFEDLLAAARRAFPASLREEALLDALDRALAARILDERDDLFVFRHPLFRAALYGQTPTHRRSHLHAAVAEGIERRRPQEVEALAYHYVRSHNKDKALEYLRRAGDRAAALRANDMAEAHYRELLSRVDRHADPTEKAAVHAKLGWVLSALGRFDEALDELKQAADMYQGIGDLESFGRAMVGIGRVHAQRGSWDEGIQKVRAALAVLEGADVPESQSIPAVYAVLAWLLYVGRQYEESYVQATQASGLARRSGDEAIVARAEVSRGVALFQLERYDEAREVLEAAVGLVKAVDDLDMMGRALNNLAALHMLDGRFDLSRSLLEQALQASQRLAEPTRLAFLTFRLGVNAYFAGRRDAARDYFERAISVARLVKEYWAEPYPLFGLALVHDLENNPEQAAQYMGESVASAERIGGLHVLRGPHSLLAEYGRFGTYSRDVHDRLLELLVGAGIERSDALSLLAIATNVAVRE